jgi:hypothetical protein
MRTCPIDELLKNNELDTDKLHRVLKYCRFQSIYVSLSEAAVSERMSRRSWSFSLINIKLL